MGEVVTLTSSRTSFGSSVEKMIDLIEAGGFNVYVMRGELGLFLAFEHARKAKQPEAFAEALVALQLLTCTFRDDPALQQAMADAALSEGSYYRSV